MTDRPIVTGSTEVLNTVAANLEEGGCLILDTESFEEESWPWKGRRLVRVFNLTPLPGAYTKVEWVDLGPAPEEGTPEAHMTGHEISFCDLRGTCYHEHAHAAVARHFGASASVQIWKPEGRDTYGHHRLWSGRLLLDESQLGPREKVITGLAGRVANVLFEEPDVEPSRAMELVEEEYGGFSEADAGMCEGYTLEDVEDCLDLLRQLWPEIQERVEQEIAAAE